MGISGALYSGVSGLQSNATAMTVIGNNMSLVQNAGDANTGDSRVAVLSTSAATTDTLPVRVVDVVLAVELDVDVVEAVLEVVLVVVPSLTSSPTSTTSTSSYLLFFIDSIL